ncbi:hypothetical protein E4U43_004913 [Claviceps pusilla]|uniref:glycogenin glucosyltransferase n=1 Tax=Claviceps pusilla TaxID=123648 RepID=A0A9P7NH55_9HYPO|nr:hypothetical protein E4U43_004913 [Claviceps pusilla]
MLLSDSYLPGALVLGHSLRDAGTRKKLAALVTLDTVSASSISQLEAVYDYILPVPRVRNEHTANLSLMNRSDLHSAFTKINLWKQTQFSKIVYMDADVVAYRAPDELFDLPHAFSAAPDIGWPDISNTGVMVLTPNMGDYYAMLAMAERGISFDGADQGLINMHFKHSTNRLSFTYNVTPSAHYQYIPAYLHFQSSISMVHFIGANKPWFVPRNSAHHNNPVDDMLGRWWAVHDRHYKYGAQTSVSAIEQRHEHHEPDAVDINASFNPINDTPKSPLAHTFNAHAEENDKSASLFPGQAGKSATRTGFHYNHYFHDNKFGKSTACTIRGASNPQSKAAAFSSAHEQLGCSKPEAVDFPTAHYEMSHDTAPFVPPMRYPSPPKDMWYEVPKRPPTSAGKPRQIFPWEAKQPTPSRSFAHPVTHEPDLITSAAGASSLSERSGKGSPYESSSSDSGLPITTSETRNRLGADATSAPLTTGDPWNFFSRANAWDDLPGISRYVEDLQRHRRTNKRTDINKHGIAMSSSGTIGTLRMPRALRVTDFPTEVERPSLPVTPAPIKRPSFWSDEKSHSDAGDEAHSLPVAEGVPSQSDWVCVHERRWKPADCPCNFTDVLLQNKDPAAQLQKLARQQSEALLRRLGEDRELSQEIPSRPLLFESETLQLPSYVAHAPPSSSLVTLQPVPGKGGVPTRLVEASATAGIPSSKVQNNVNSIGTAKY